MATNLQDGFVEFNASMHSSRFKAETCTKSVPMDEVMRLVEQARADHYRDLRCFFHGEEHEDMEQVDEHHLHTVVLPATAHAVGKRIVDLELGAVGISALRRGSIRGEAPDANLKLQANDALVLEGSTQQLELAESYLLGGLGGI